MPDSQLQELWSAAAPACGACGEPIIRTEHSWRRDAEDKEWRLTKTMVCSSHHRTRVKPIEETK